MICIVISRQLATVGKVEQGVRTYFGPFSVEDESVGVGVGGVAIMSIHSWPIARLGLANNTGVFVCAVVENVCPTTFHPWWQNRDSAALELAENIALSIV